MDQSSGVPLDDSGIIEQIPLGGQVFPFDDLHATERPHRIPLYGDDVIPTTALVVGRHPTLVAPQAIFTDTKNNLMVRDAVFQSNGVPIPAGTTAPIDVNNVGGGSGGSMPIVTLATPEGNGIVNQTYAGSALVFPGDVTGFYSNKYLLGFSIGFQGLLAAAGNSNYAIVRLTDKAQTVAPIPLATISLVTQPSVRPIDAVNQTIVFPFKVDTLASVGSAQWIIIVGLAGAPNGIGVGLQPYVSNT